MRIPRPLPLLVLAAAFLAVTAPLGGAQSFADNTTSIPQGAPGNNSYSEDVAFADVDLDGDYDALWADGGDCCNDLDRLWINQGGLQGGTLGVFVDDTDARMPAVADDSRDVDFVDLDQDGDFDIYVSNTSTIINQGSRFLINQGGTQAGTLGYFTDETTTRWVNVGINGPETSSSISPLLVIGSGPFTNSFVTWAGEGLFGDLDNDGDPDLVHATYGPAFTGAMPTRVFLNDGNGFFEEYNPSDFVVPGVAIADGDPALWAEGTQIDGTTVYNGSEADIASAAVGAELGDTTGDFDLDLLLGGLQDHPRVFHNRTAVNGGTFAPLRDVTADVFAQQAFGGGNYEQEFGDFDNDNDLDIFGLNWAGVYFDAVARNDGTGHYANLQVLPDSGSDDSDGNFFDFDNDGALDIYVANYSGQDRLYENSGSPGWTFANATAAELPTLTRVGLGLETADVDFDGDTDVFVANDNGTANYYLENLTNVPDTTAPRVVAEPVADRVASPVATRVRATVYDNASWNKIQFAAVEVEYTVDGGAAQLAAMHYAGGQNFSGAIDGTLVGTIVYFVRATDDHGNVGISPVHQYLASGPVSYCTAGTSAGGCQAQISANGMPSATAASGFTLDAAGVEGRKDGLYFFGTNGRQGNSWGNGSSLQCVTPPVKRAALMVGVGTAGVCNGTFSQDLNARWQFKPNQNPGAGAVVQAQLWYRDPLNTSNQTTSLSDAVEFTVGP